MPGASAHHDGAPPCRDNGMVSAATCIATEAVKHCTPPTIVNWCYGNIMVDSLEAATYACEFAVGNRCPL